ncbi:MAG: 4Fe-4S cluster-binding domain-containing protein [Planctomycetes bacterium]|nr:4Fe-4S cluster-binding domain-containing protein [Planctomycetota bacterium]
MGRPHLFVRLGGCPLRCSYCDTPRSWKAKPSGELHLPTGTERFDNPLSPVAFAELLDRLTSAHEADWSGLVIAVTGGEPLEQVDFLQHWLPHAPAPVLLETAGIHAKALKRVLPLLRFVSLDAKDPVDLSAGAELDAYVVCLRATAAEAARRTSEQPLTFWTKFVMTENTDSSWLQGRLRAIAAEVPGATVFLQPVTPRRGSPAAPSSDQLLCEVLAAQGLALDLRVLPQVHTLLEIR